MTGALLVLFASSLVKGERGSHYRMLLDCSLYDNDFSPIYAHERLSRIADSSLMHHFSYKAGHTECHLSISSFDLFVFLAKHMMS